MAGTKLGGLHARDTVYKKYGPDFYKTIGRKGGLLGRTGGFAANPELARIAGKKGGHKSKRSKVRTDGCKCKCDPSYVIGVDYGRLADRDLSYDGIGEWQCRNCNRRWCRWTGRELKENEYPMRYGKGIKYVPPIENKDFQPIQNT